MYRTPTGDPVTKKGQKIRRPPYRQMYEEVCANETRLNDLLSTACHNESIARRDLATARTLRDDAIADYSAEHAANLRHRKIELALGVTDILLAGAMLWLLAR